jgi:RNA polymerase sigma factor (sigma-70 family)
MPNAKLRKCFEQLALIHLDAAYNLAMRLTRNAQDAEDLVQEAYLRAFEAFARFQGTHSKAWVLTIVRNTFYTWQRLQRLHPEDETFEESLHTVAHESHGVGWSRIPETPERAVLLQADIDLVNRCLDALPTPLREVLVLREFEGLSYQEIAGAIGVPKGTVMSRLSRARQHLQHLLAQQMRKT